MCAPSQLTFGPSGESSDWLSEARSRSTCSPLSGAPQYSGLRIKFLPTDHIQTSQRPLQERLGIPIELVDEGIAVAHQAFEKRPVGLCL